MKVKHVPCVPLITHDPYCSIWSASDCLWQADPTHWSGLPQKLFGKLTVDGKDYVFLGLPHSLSSIPQTNLEITPLSTEYTFENEAARLNVRFTSPLLLDEPLMVSRPCSYIDFSLRLYAGSEASVQLAVSDQLVCRDHRRTIGRTMTCPAKEGRPPFRCVSMGAADQKPLSHSGDHVTIDWGYVYLASQNAAGEYEYDEARQEIRTRLPFEISGHEGRASMVFAYDDLLSINYMGQWRKAYWTQTYTTILDAIGAALADREETLARADKLDRDLTERARAWGGEDYAYLCCMSYRQAVAGHKLVTDEQGNLLFLSKENDSNGCIGTVDVSYPSMPLFMLYNTEYVKGMLRPIFAFALSDVWEYDFAPHDMGRYPYAWGQVYACRLRQKTGPLDVYPPLYQYPAGSEIYDFEKQMPVEECGNMLLMTAAVCLADGSGDFARPYLPILRRWVSYLQTYGADPGEQLCTDDFAGHLSHNTNLSVKAILGIEAFAHILTLLGETEEAASFHGTAKEMAADWEKRADAGDHYRLTFDRPDSWSLKYNLVWDRLFGSGLFSAEVFRKETACYLRQSRRYGTPLDSRREYTKSDWEIWCAAMADSKKDAAALVHPVRLYLEETACNVPFSDWYDTETGYFCSFRARTVQGGIFMPLLVQQGLSEK